MDPWGFYPASPIPDLATLQIANNPNIAANEAPNNSLLGPGEGFIPADWPGLQINLKHPGQRPILQTNMDALPPGDFRWPNKIAKNTSNQDVPLTPSHLPLPKLFCYGAGGDHSTDSMHHACIQLPDLTDARVAVLEQQGQNIALLVAELTNRNIHLDNVPVYINMRSLPSFPANFSFQTPGGWDKNNISSVTFNYFTHCWTHDRMIENRNVAVATGVYATDGIIAGASPIGMNSLVSQGQNFHDRNYLSGNMHQLRFTQPDPNQPMSQVASGWFLAIGPNNKAIICYELINKGFAFDSSSNDISMITQNLAMDGTPSISSLVDAFNAAGAAGPGLSTKLAAVFRGYGLM